MNLQQVAYHEYEGIAQTLMNERLVHISVIKN